MPNSRPAIERFSEKARRLDNGCIEWTGHVDRKGYARLHINGRSALAHRWAYEFHIGPIPADRVIDHLCRNRKCVNPEHLEPVTNRENVLRGIGPQLVAERYRAITHCPAGHAYTAENTHVGPRGRRCLTCKRRSARKWFLQNRELANERARRRREKKKAEAA